jgi:hypothetical protein
MEIKRFRNLNKEVNKKYDFNQIFNSLKIRKLFYRVKSNSVILVLDLN